MKNNKFIYAFILTIIPFLLFSQTNYQTTDGYTIEGRLLSKNTKEPIAYAHVYNKSTGKGTISNLEGFFKLNVKNPSDSIFISFIGYKKQQLHLDKQKDFYQIFLEESVLLLDEATIVPNDDSYLYDLLDDCKKNQSKIATEAKVYYELKSFINTDQVELVECFYNGNITGYNLEKLDLKIGRIALQTNKDRFFISLESSKAITMLQLFSSNGYFPQSPLELSKRKLKSNYLLSLSGSYKNDNLDSIYIVEFTPKDTSGNFFTGQIWVNYLKKNIIKVKLKCSNTARHPFLPLSSTDSIKNVALEITKSFEEINGKMYFKHIDFIYHITYKSSNNQVYNVSANAILYSYDFSNIFSLPNFEFPDDNLSDYIKISAIPYNDFFWKNNEELKVNDQENKNELFFNDKNSITNRTLFSLNQFIKKGLLAHPYLIWSVNRMPFREFNTNNSGNVLVMQEELISEQYDLNVQLFLDINLFADTLQFITAAVFDPYESYYDLPVDNSTLCFINTYFDLVEIERRALEEEIQKSDKSIEEIKKLYEASLVKIGQLKQKYFKEVGHGSNKKEMKKWNRYVFENLEINNIELFAPYEDKE